MMICIDRFTYGLGDLDLVADAEVLDGVVEPERLGVLVEAEPSDVEVLGDLVEDGHGVPEQHVEPAALLLELLVQVLQALQQEGHLVVLAHPMQVMSYESCIVSRES